MSPELRGPARVARGWLWAGLAAAAIGVAGCGHHRNVPALPTQGSAPTVYAPGETTPPERYPTTPVEPRTRIEVTPVPDGGVSQGDLDYVLTHRPIYSEEGAATWYTAPYKGRKAANGQVFSDDALTAANRTLPMGSLVVVTNLKTRQASAMRISDRGPFSPGKIIDLTKASAKATGVYRMGTAPVRVDVYWTPKPIETGGRWCVQIGAFTSARRAEQLKAQLQERYPEARVIEFPGERSYWVRIRPQGDDRERAEYIADHVHPSQGEAYLTRLD